jgi:hypothetical protein
VFSIAPHFIGLAVVAVVLRPSVWTGLVSLLGVSLATLIVIGSQPDALHLLVFVSAGAFSGLFARALSWRFKSDLFASIIGSIWAAALSSIVWIAFAWLTVRIFGDWYSVFWGGPFFYVFYFVTILLGSIAGASLTRPGRDR